jgi:hypothetical protein
MKTFRKKENISQKRKLFGKTSNFREKLSFMQKVFIVEARKHNYLKMLRENTRCNLFKTKLTKKLFKFSYLHKKLLPKCCFFSQNVRYFSQAFFAKGENFFAQIHVRLKRTCTVFARKNFHPSRKMLAKNNEHFAKKTKKILVVIFRVNKNRFIPIE